MKRLLSFLLIAIASIITVNAQTDDSMSDELKAMLQDSIKGQAGEIHLPEAHCTINTPEGFVFLDPDKARHLLVDYWNNPADKVSDLLGVLVKDNAQVYMNVETAYVVSYDNSGYVSDEDADKIDFDQLLADMRKDLKEENNASPSQEQWDLIGWGWQPSYDKARKVISWSKHYRIDGQYEVINYDVRVLGKEGFVVITAVGDPEAKNEMLADDKAIVGSVRYDNGYTYADFNPDTDHIAEWTIGGLIAGKVLTKIGLWGFIAKFSKLIIIAVIAFIGAFRKKIAALFSRRKDDDEENPADGNATATE